MLLDSDITLLSERKGRIIIINNNIIVIIIVIIIVNTCRPSCCHADQSTQGCGE